MHTNNLKEQQRKERLKKEREPAGLVKKVFEAKKRGKKERRDHFDLAPASVTTELTVRLRLPVQVDENFHEPESHASDHPGGWKAPRLCESLKKKPGKGKMEQCHQ